MKMTTTDLVNKIFIFCEAYSGVQFFPYQAQFAKRIIRSVLENDGEEISALFSRQCVSENSKVLLSNGERKSIRKIKVGQYVKAFDCGEFVDAEVISSYSTGKKECFELKLKSGIKIDCTANHRFLDRGTKLFKPLYNFEAGDEIGYYDNGEIKFSRIRDIKPKGIIDTWDIEVSGVENFVCNKVVTHNSGKSETVASISGGLAIILPTLANLPMFAGDHRLELFKDGLMMEIFAPTLRQSKIVFNRMKKRMGSKYADAVMSDPEIDVTFDVSNGENIILSNGSIICCQSASDGSNIEGDSCMLIIVDEAQDVGNFKYLKSISPMGAFYNATKILIGTSSTSKGFFYDAIERNKNEYIETGKRNHFEYDYNTVIKYNPRYEKYVKGEKKRLGEDSDEFRMAYCLKWILERGMFFDPKVFESMMDKNKSLSIMDTKHSHVAGIDLGKKSDSTIITILEVDWDNPVIVEKSKSMDADVPDYIGYYTTVKAWLEIQGDDWNEQYDMIVSFLSNFNVVRVVLDGTGVGDAIYDRLRANLNFEVVPYVFSKQSKSDLYKHLNTEARAGRLSIPADEASQNEREFSRFTQQCMDLEKSYSGQLMVVSHPDARDAHDDYPDSLALAVWGAKGEGVSRPESEDNLIFRKTEKRFTSRRNNITARRRR